MLSGLPQLANKQFVIGFVAPIILFALSLGTLDPELLKQVTRGLGTGGDNLIDVVLTILALWFGALLLMLANRLIIRFFSGYLWPLKNWAGQQALVAECAQERAWFEANHPTVLTLATTDPAVRSYNARLFDYYRRFPSSEVLVLGTRFGNAMRAFELYPDRAYKVDGVALWPRLEAVISKDYLETLGDAQSQVNFWVNLSFFAAVMALIGPVPLLWAILDGTITPTLDKSELILLWLPFGALASYVSYHLAIERLTELGERTRSAVDVFYPTLISKLAFERPTTSDDREALGNQLEQTYLYYQPVVRPWEPAGSKDGE